MKNDFEFIKDKLDSAKIVVPAELNEENILKKTEDIKQKRIIHFDLRAFSAAAVLAVFVLSAVIASSVFANMPAMIKDESVSGLMRFTKREAVISSLAEAISETRYNEEYFYYDRGFGFVENKVNYSQKSVLSGIRSESSAGSSAGHNATYIQETNVDEADVVKTTPTHLFYLNDNGIEVFTADGKSSKRVAFIKPKRVKKSYVDPQEFYIYGEKLILLEEYTPNTSFSSVVRAEYFDISDLSNIKLVDSFTQSGRYCSSRMTGGKLYIISAHYPTDDMDLPRASRSLTATGDEATPDEIPPYDIYCAKSPESSQFLIVSELDTDSREYKSYSKALLGSADEIYCNENHLYITAECFKNRKSGKDIPSIETRIFKVDLKDDLKFVASAKIDGEINNQYSMDEKDGNLRVATTATDKKGRDCNNLYILDKNLKMTGSVTNFAVEESIKAVRYIGDTAYVITYEQTDPLFVIDLKIPSKPKILGKVKISGFSTMLVPVDDNTLLGIGYHTQDEDDDIDMEIEEGMKLVLFDVSDKSRPKVLDTKIYKNCCSAVQDDPKALLVNFERNDYTIPINDEDTLRGGTLNFRVENGKIKVIDRYTSMKFDDETERCAYVGNTIYLFAQNYDDSSAVQIDSVDYKFTQNYDNSAVQIDNVADK